jgi:hypothetical protein
MKKARRIASLFHFCNFFRVVCDVALASFISIALM